MISSYLYAKICNTFYKYSTSTIEEFWKIWAVMEKRELLHCKDVASPV